MYEGLQSPFAREGQDAQSQAQELAWDIANLAFSGSREIVSMQLDMITSDPIACESYMGSVHSVAIAENNLHKSEAELHDTKRKLWLSENIDTMTGLFNKHAWQVDLGRKLEIAEAKGGQVAVLFCDLDGFKGVNDHLGHDFGDVVIERVADYMQSQLRTGSANPIPDAIGHEPETGRSVDDSNTVSHWGGDEYAVTLYLGPEGEDAVSPYRRSGTLTPEQQIEAVRMRLQDGITKLAAEMGAPFGLSIGAALSEPGITAQYLTKLADAAMYVHKQEKKDVQRATWDPEDLAAVEAAEATIAAAKAKYFFMSPR